MSENKQSNAVATLENKSITYQANGEDVTLNINTVKTYLTRGNAEIETQEAVMFLNLCKYQKLNPFLNEAYLVKFKSKDERYQQPAQLIVGKEAFMKRAEDHEKFEGFRAGLIVSRNDEIVNTEGSFTIKGDILLGGWCEVYRSDRKHPIVAQVSFEEYDKGQSIWKEKPKTMIRKIAIVQAFREAFPKNLGGMYIEEEASYEVVKDSAPTEKKTDANSKPFVINEDKPAPKTTTKESSQIVDVVPEDIPEKPGF